MLTEHNSQQPNESNEWRCWGLHAYKPIQQADNKTSSERDQIGHFEPHISVLQIGYAALTSISPFRTEDEPAMRLLSLYESSRYPRLLFRPRPSPF